MKINLIVVGKISEKFFDDAIKEYSKRLSRYCTLSIIEVKDEKTKENSTSHEIDVIKNKEGERILAKVPEDSYVIALCIDGKMLDSVEYANMLSKLSVEGKSNITLIIGGSLGLADAVVNRADYKLSFSKMTFPHQLMRVILLEQTYRAYRIINGEPYHK